MAGEATVSAGIILTCRPIQRSRCRSEARTQTRCLGAGGRQRHRGRCRSRNRWTTAASIVSGAMRRAPIHCPKCSAACRHCCIQIRRRPRSNRRSANCSSHGPSGLALIRRQTRAPQHCSNMGCSFLAQGQRNTPMIMWTTKSPRSDRTPPRHRPLPRTYRTPFHIIARST